MRPRQLWVIAGITDRDKIRAHAQHVWETDGQRSVIHFHSHFERCSGGDADHEFVPEIKKQEASDATHSDKGQ